MKISKIAIAVVFAAVFLTASASSSMATSCAEGFVAVEGEFPEPMYTCEEVSPADATVDGPIDVKPIVSCWTEETGVDVCSRNSAVPMTTSAEETLLDGEVCDPAALGVVEAEGNTPESCVYDAVPYEVSGADGGELIVDDGTVDETLMYQSGVVKAAAAPDQTASNTLAAFGVLVGALGALGIGLSREREAKN